MKNRAISWRHGVLAGCLVAFLAGLAGCSKPPRELNSKGQPLREIIFQTDWYAEPEHGGFYHALLKGYYEEAGLKVIIKQGGPNALGPEKVATGKADFSIARGDDVIIYANRGIPLLIVAAYMQIDPQAIMLHADSPVNSWEALNGTTIMCGPAAFWADILMNRYHIKFSKIPMDFGLERFIADDHFIQQCFITNEPYYMGLKGIKTKTMLIADSGYSPNRVLYTSRRFAEENPDTVEKFVHASIRGWRDFMTEDPSPTLHYLAGINPKLTDQFMDYGYRSMKKYQLVKGKGRDPVGGINRQQMESLVEDLFKNGIIKKRLPPATFLTTEFLPAGKVP